ncbi:ActR/RegA family two-component response regulator [Bradyrhizobium sp. i1.3.6]
MRRTAGPIDYLRPWHRLIATPYVDVQREDNTLNAIAELNEQTDRSLLIVEDDKPFLERLSRAMETRGFAVTSCDTVSDGLAQIGKAAPAFAVVDLRLGDGNGLDVVSALKKKRPEARAIVLTGYGNIATAVTAVKMGAIDYLSKPADARRRRRRPALDQLGEIRVADQPDVRRPRPLGAHPAHLRDVQPQRLGDGAPAEYAPSYVAADSGEARAAVTVS